MIWVPKNLGCIKDPKDSTLVDGLKGPNWLVQKVSYNHGSFFSVCSRHSIVGVPTTFLYFERKGAHHKTTFQFGDPLFFHILPQVGKCLFVLIVLLCYHWPYHVWIVTRNHSLIIILGST